MPRGGKFIILSRQPEPMDLAITQSGKSNGTTGERHCAIEAPCTSFSRFRTTEQSRERPRTAQALLPWLTLPLRPTQFPCAPPLLWLTCRGAALWLPWWPGPAPARVRREHCQWRKGLLLRVATHMPAKHLGFCFCPLRKQKTWNGLTVPFRGCFSFPQHPHLPSLLSNNNTCGSRLALSPRRALTARPGQTDLLWP